MLFAPLEGWRHVEGTDQHTAVDFARILKGLSDTHFPEPPKIALVRDNLNTHKRASLYEAFPPAEARWLIERFPAVTPWNGQDNTVRGTNGLRAASTRPRPRRKRPRTMCST
jgi:hypothetical protein